MINKELILSEERLKMVLEGSDLGFWDWDIEKDQVIRNDRWAQILGYSTIDEFDNNTDSWTELIHPDDRDAAWKSINDHLKGLTAFHYMEYRMLTKEGGYKWILDQARIVQRDPDGRPLRMSGTHLDITDRKESEAVLKESEERFRTVSKLSNDILWEWHTDNDIVNWFGNIDKQLGYEENEIPRTLDGWKNIIHPDDLERVENSLGKSLEERKPWFEEYRAISKDGRIQYWVDRGEIRIGQDENNFILTGAIKDITERKLVEEALKESENKYRTLFQYSGDAILIIDGDKFVDCNPATMNMLGCKNKNELLNTHPSQLSPQLQPDGRSSIEKANEMISIAFDQGTNRFVWDHMRLNGEVFPVEVLLTAIPFEGRKILHVVWRDITRRKQMEEELKHLATHDPLTGLYNRQEFEQRLSNEIDRASRYKHTLSVFMLDIDHFKSVNDTYGHQTGDTVLRLFAELINNSIRKTDYASRYGGEEFLVLLPETSLVIAIELAERLCNNIYQYSFPLDDNKELNITASIGVASIPEHAQSSKDLIKAADSSMYAAKEAGRNQVKTISN
jgi:diguanylate cyclase